MSALADSYALTDDQLAFRDTIRQMVRERVAPRAAEIDEQAEYPWDLRQLFAEHDLFGLPFEEEHGGTGTGALMLCIAIEEVAKACASSALMLAVQDLGTLPIKLFGSDELKRALPAQVRDRRVVAGVRAVRARGRLRSRRHDHEGRARRRRVGHQRHEELDHEPRDRRLLRRLRRHRSERRPLARHQRLRRRERPSRLQRRQAGEEARHQGLADRPADLRGRARSPPRT